MVSPAHAPRAIPLQRLHPPAWLMTRAAGFPVLMVMVVVMMVRSLCRRLGQLQEPQVLSGFPVTICPLALSSGSMPAAPPPHRRPEIGAGFYVGEERGAWGGC